MSYLCVVPAHWRVPPQLGVSTSQGPLTTTSVTALPVSSLMCPQWSRPLATLPVLEFSLCCPPVPPFSFLSDALLSSFTPRALGRNVAQPQLLSLLLGLCPSLSGRPRPHMPRAPPVCDDSGAGCGSALIPEVLVPSLTQAACRLRMS